MCRAVYDAFQLIDADGDGYITLADLKVCRGGREGGEGRKGGGGASATVASLTSSCARFTSPYGGPSPLKVERALVES